MPYRNGPMVCQHNAFFSIAFCRDGTNAALSACALRREAPFARGARHDTFHDFAGIIAPFPIALSALAAHLGLLPRLCRRLAPRASPGAGPPVAPQAAPSKAPL